jgi:hypothetical protein
MESVETKDYNQKLKDIIENWYWKNENK